MQSIAGLPIVTAAEMRAAEERAIAAGASVESLVERVGAGVAEWARRLSGGAEVLVLCGPGNNGGDGYVAARVLRAAGVPVRVAATGEPRSDACRAARTGWDGAVEEIAEASPAPLVVDAVFGTGLTRDLDEEVAHSLWIATHGARLSIAVDLPSGVDTDTGSSRGLDHDVDVTLALGALKPAHVLLPSATYCGEVRMLDIGVPVESDARAMVRLGAVAPGVCDHKFSRGMVAVIAGRMPGAAALAASAAARIAGYTMLLGSTTDRLPHAIVRRRWSAEQLEDQRLGAVVIGPGLGRDDEAQAKLAAAIASDRPLVIDGDALHLLDLAAVRGRRAATILTPHRGEFVALFGDGSGSKIDRAHDAAAASGATIVFKGADTVVASPEGQVRVAHHPAPWLASAGTGDTLAGIIGGLLAHRGQPLVAANDGVLLHTAAALHAGPGLIADDLVTALPHVLDTRP